MSAAKVSCPFRVRPKQGLPPVGRGRLSLEQSPVAQPLDQPAQVPGVQSQLPAQLAGGRLVAVGELVEQADLRQGEPAAQQPFVEDADAAGVEAIEPSHRIDGRHRGRRHVVNVNYSVAVVKYW